MVMYGIYNTLKALEKCINTIHQMHNITAPNERLFVGKLGSSFTWYLNKDGVHHYAINTLSNLRTVREKYVIIYEEFLTQLHIYAKVIRILSKVYLPISLILPSKLQEILNAVKEVIWTTFDRDRHLIIQFSIFVQLYTQQPLILYQIETVPVPIIDQNKQTNSYSHFQIDKLYIALISETYISIRQ